VLVNPTIPVDSLRDTQLSQKVLFPKSLDFIPSSNVPVQAYGWCVIGLFLFVLVILSFRLLSSRSAKLSAIGRESTV